MHAIMEWLLPQDTITFLVNDVQRPPLLETPRHPDLGAVPESDLLLISFEHDTPDAVIRHADEIEFVNYRRRSVILMIRDPLNFLASTIRHWRNIDRTSWQIESVLCNVVPAWKALAKEVVGDTDYIRNKIVVNFNTWFCDLSYRQLISRALGLRFTDESRNHLATTGGWISSAFDGRSYAGRATDMKVLERWRAFVDDKMFRTYFDEEMKELGHRIYGPWMPVLLGEVGDARADTATH
jgi:hypothetical protein